MPSTNSIRSFFGRFVNGRSSKRSNTTGIFSDDFRGRNNNNREGSDFLLDLSYSHHSSTEELGAVIDTTGANALELRLNNSRLKTVPKEVFRCSEVRVLNLSENELVELPPGIASLLWLEELYLDKNDVDSIPESLKCCKRLRVLHLNFLPIIQVPVCIPDLLNVTELCLNGCGVDCLPPSLGFLSHLRILEVRQNRLSFLPGALGRLSHLQRLDVGRNRIRALPDTLPSLARNLETLLCDWNELTELPDGFEEMERLDILDLCGNFFRKFPDCFNEFRHLSSFYAADNELTSLPESLTACSKLNVLNLDNNRIMELPKNIGRLENLVDFSVRGNKLSALPPGVGSLKNLEMLLLDSNFITTLPHEIAGLDSLTILSLRGNKVEFLCREIGALDELKVLDLRGNQLNHLPRAIKRISDKIAAIWLADNQTSPKVPLIEATEPISGRRVMTCVLLPQQVSPLSKDPQDGAWEKQEWSISPSRLYQWDRRHGEKIRAEIEETRRLHPGKKARKIHNEVHVLPSSPRWGSMAQAKKDEGPPPPIRPYAMVDLKTLQAQLLAERKEEGGERSLSAISSSHIPWYMQGDREGDHHPQYNQDKRASAPVGHYEAIFEGLGKGLKPNNGNLVAKPRPESHYEKLYDKRQVPDRHFTSQLHIRTESSSSDVKQLSPVRDHS